MEQPSRQERRREELKRNKQARREAARAWRERQAGQDLQSPPRATSRAVRVNGKRSRKKSKRGKIRLKNSSASIGRRCPNY